MFSFYHLKNLKSLTKCPHLILHTTGKELPWEDAFRLSPLPSLHSTARGKQENTKKIRHHFDLNENKNMTYPNMGDAAKLVFREKFSIKCLYL